MCTYARTTTQNPFADGHSFIGNITLDFIDYNSFTIPLWSTAMLSVPWKAWRFVSKEFAAFKESASVKKNGRKQSGGDYSRTSI